MEQEQVVTFFSEGIRHVLQAACLNFGNIYEIRLRVSQPLLLSSQEGEIFLDDKGRRTRDLKRAFRVTAEELSETLEIISEYSLYAYEEELRQGFLTVPGGHRVGVAGRTVLSGKRVDGMRDISCLNLRLAHEKKGCADSVFSWLYGTEVDHTLIISPPRCGKTTLLRDLIRQISNGTSSCPGRTVGVVDERSEIAGCYQGIAQNDLAILTYVLDGCPKDERLNKQYS